MKVALVLEGGAMQGMYTAGVLDEFIENGISFDGIIGVSAGALFGVNFLSGQKGRVIRYNKRFNSDKNYMGIKPLIKTGNIVDTEYAYVRVPRELEPFDDEAYKSKSADVPFYAVVTNIKTGQAEYRRINSVFDQMDTLRASGSMPFVSTPVEIDGELYLDGAIADSIPFEHMLELGYDKLVVVLTKSAEYIKKPMPKALAVAMYQRKYPLFAKAIKERHIMYRAQQLRLAKLEKDGIAHIIRPSRALYVHKIEGNPERLEELYQLGRADGAAEIARVEDFRKA